MPNTVQFIRKFWPLAIATLLIVLSWVGIHQSNRGLTSRNLTADGIPMQFIAPQQTNSVPGVIIAHGFSGSKQLMLGYAQTLAHNGYGVLSWDLPGHGANTHPFEYDSLQASFEVALPTIQAQPEIDPKRLAVIGHSMGAGVAMTGGINHGGELDAVIAISPMDAAVTPDTPKNLSLQVGEWEPWLIPYTQKLLQTAGGLNSNLDEGKGRSLSIIPNVEHATILFKDDSHQRALKWLNQTFGIENTSTFRDRRMAWYGLHLLGWLIAVGTILPLLIKSEENALSPTPKLRAWSGLLLSPIAGIGALKLMNLISPVDQIGGMMIGGALGIWFLIAGVVWLGMVAQYPRPQLSDLWIGIVGFACLWIGFGVMAQVTWLPWFLTSKRLLLWGTIAIACLPWFLASGIVQQNAKLSQRLGWWLGQTITVLSGLIISIMVLPPLGFLALMLPVFPLLIGLFSFLAAKTNSSWSYALTCAPILGWLIVVPFPLT